MHTIDQLYDIQTLFNPDKDCL